MDVIEKIKEEKRIFVEGLKSKWKSKRWWIYSILIATSLYYILGAVFGITSSTYWLKTRSLLDRQIPSIMETIEAKGWDMRSHTYELDHFPGYRFNTTITDSGMETIAIKKDPSFPPLFQDKDKKEKK